jgi:hypothetical protein
LAITMSRETGERKGKKVRKRRGKKARKRRSRYLSQLIIEIILTVNKDIAIDQKCWGHRYM